MCECCGIHRAVKMPPPLPLMSFAVFLPPGESPRHLATLYYPTSHIAPPNQPNHPLIAIAHSKFYLPN